MLVDESLEVDAQEALIEEARRRTRRRRLGYAAGALAVAVIATIYLGVLPSRVLDYALDGARALVR